MSSQYRRKLLAEMELRRALCLAHVVLHGPKPGNWPNGRKYLETGSLIDCLLFAVMYMLDNEDILQTRRYIAKTVKPVAGTQRRVPKDGGRGVKKGDCWLRFRSSAPLVVPYCYGEHTRQWEMYISKVGKKFTYSYHNCTSRNIQHLRPYFPCATAAHLPTSIRLACLDNLL